MKEAGRYSVEGERQGSSSLLKDFDLAGLSERGQEILRPELLWPEKVEILRTAVSKVRGERCPLAR